ncbi:uridine kinase [Brevibacterium aurantiacum]|uniref:Uridine kinase n=1 Tax=Brevibacterium aurantiacum TaxID=273384 RepID=A0A556C4Z9_BREAU|nr:uridine kinase [Brevibacterium aurantiacum]
MLTNELVDLAAGCDREVVGLSIDGFHHPRATRYAKGTGPESFYHSSYDYPAFLRFVVEPLRAGRSVIPAVWDVEADVPVQPCPLDLSDDCILLVEGIFLHRAQLRDCWDASVWVDVPFAVSVPRGNLRFSGSFDPDPDSELNHRYVGGQRIYFRECSPWEQATWIFDNTDLGHPSLSTSSLRHG